MEGNLETDYQLTRPNQAKGGVRNHQRNSTLAMRPKQDTEHGIFSLVSVSSSRNEVKSFCWSILYFERTLLKGTLVMQVPRRIYSVLFDGFSVGALIESMK